MGNLSEEDLVNYLKEGGYIKKDCWQAPLHVEYNPSKATFGLVTISHTYNGDRGFCTFESYPELSKIKYAGNWVKCSKNGEELE